MDRDLFFSHSRLVKLCCIALPIALIVCSVLALVPPAQVPLAMLGDNALHAGAFFVLAALLDIAWPDGSLSAKILWLTAYGSAIELAQSLHPLRTMMFDDLVADIVGLSLYFASTPLLKHLPIIRLRWHKPE